MSAQGLLQPRGHSPHTDTHTHRLTDTHIHKEGDENRQNLDRAEEPYQVPGCAPTVLEDVVATGVN